MREYIEREAVLKHARPIEVGAFSEMDVVTVENIKSVPAADVVEVVRCKECKYLMFSDMYGECGRGYMGIVSPDDFCSYGERKDGANK